MQTHMRTHMRLHIHVHVQLHMRRRMQMHIQVRMHLHLHMPTRMRMSFWLCALLPTYIERSPLMRMPRVAAQPGEQDTTYTSISDWS